MVRFYTSSLMKDPTLFCKIGLICFVAIQGYSVVKQASREKETQMKQEMLEQLAYTDILTSLPNRTCYEKRKEEYKQKETEKSLFVMVVDLNNLKSINDQFGHMEGDRAIIRMAKILGTCFDKERECFRIGGDEFLVLAEMEETDFMEKLSEMKEQIFIANKTLPYDFSAAYGYRITAPKEIDEAIMQADFKMYQQKAEMKNN